MVAVAQLVERWIVVPVVGDSTSLRHPKEYMNKHFETQKPNKRHNFWHFLCAGCKKAVKTSEAWYLENKGQFHKDCLEKHFKRVVNSMVRVADSSNVLTKVR